MAFVPGFEQDIFISFAHTDNTRRLTTEATWIEDLHHVLSQRLAKRLGRTDYFTIWWDRRLSGYDRIDPVIEKMVRGSALFLCVLSPGYLASSYCCEELRLFQEASAAISHPDFALVQRILKVIHLPVPNEPELLKEVRGFTFYTVDPKKHARELWRVNQNAVNEAYWQAALDLADDIADLLVRLKDHGIVPANGQVRQAAPATVVRPLNGDSLSSIPPTVPTVFLAEVAPDVAPVHVRLRRNLKQQGLRIVPDTPLSNSARLDAELVRHLRQAHLSVHLVGADFGTPAFGDVESRSLSHVQYLRAKDLGLHRIVWADGKIQDDRQQRFIDFLESEDDPQRRVDLQRGIDFETLVEEVVKKAYAAADLARPKMQLRRKTTPQIDIACQQPDRDDAMVLKHSVYQNKFDVNVSVDDDPKFSTRYQQILKRSDALLILYGRASPFWVQERADEARDAVRRRKRTGKGPFVALIYDGPPPNKNDLPFGYHELVLLIRRDQLASDEIVTAIKNRLEGD